MSIDLMAPPVADRVLPGEVAAGLRAIVTGARAIEAWLKNSDMDSNSIGGILIPSLIPLPEMPQMKPRTKALKAE